MSNEKFPVLGFDIGGTKIAVCLAMSDGTILASTRVSNQNRAPELVLPELVDAGNKLLAEAGIDAKQLRALGIDSPSPMDVKAGIIQTPCNMPKWKDVPIRDYLSKAFGVPAFLDNDANAAGLAEWIFGAGQGVDDMIYLTMSTGIGGGIVCSGRLLRGANNYGGEVGHMVIDPDGIPCNCGLKGCYEAYCGGLAVAQHLQKELADKPESAIVKAAGGKVENINIQALVKAIEAGDEYAKKVWSDMMERNAQAMGLLLNAFNPSVIALGTIAVHCGDLFIKPLMERIQKYTWKQQLSVCKIVPSKLGGKQGEYSGISVALYALYEKGEWQLPWSR